MSKPYVGIIYIVMVIILVPICHLIAKRVYKRSFGKQLEVLQKNIEELEADK